MKITLHRDVTSQRSADDTFDYLLDFRNAEEWDSGTISCERTEGDGGVRSKYRNISKFAGREVELTYTVKKVDRERREFVIVGTTGSTTSSDTIKVTPQGERASVSYEAVFEFPWYFFPAYPALLLMTKKLGDDTAEQLAKSLRT